MQHQKKELGARLDAFEQQEKTKLARRLQKDLPRIAQTLLGKSIPVEVHEKMIFQAFEQARHTDLFQNSNASPD